MAQQITFHRSTGLWVGAALLSDKSIKKVQSRTNPGPGHLVKRTSGRRVSGRFSEPAQVSVASAIIRPDTHEPHNTSP